MRHLLIWLFSALYGWALQPGVAVPDAAIQKLALQSDKIYVIDFFASWCSSCQRELPRIDALHQKLVQRGVGLIGVDVDEEREAGRAFQHALALQMSVIDDPKGEIVSLFDPAGIPALYVVKNHKVVAVLLGAKEQIDRLLLQKLDEVAAP